jgi:hypothetical protein
MTPEERRRNVRSAIVLAIIVLALMVWTFVRGALFGVGG